MLNYLIVVEWQFSLKQTVYLKSSSSPFAVYHAKLYTCAINAVSLCINDVENSSRIDRLAHVGYVEKSVTVVLCSFRRDVLSSVPSAAQTMHMSLQQVFALLSGTQVSHLCTDDLCINLNLSTCSLLTANGRGHFLD